MNEPVDPFRPPSATLEVVPETDVAYFTAATWKFLVMSFGTFTFYCLYWFYKNFWTIRRRTGRAILPFWRTVFSIIWAYSCFRDVAGSSGRSRAAAAGLAFVFIVFSIVAHAPEPWWLISFGAIAPVCVANGWAGEANERAFPGQVRNDRMTGWNWFALAIGVPLSILVIIGTFLPQPS